MTEPSLPELEARRDRLYSQLSTVGDFRRGSVSENYRKCGKPNCACAAPGHPGHGPRFLWTRSEGRRKRVGRQLAAGEVEKVRREIARHAEFTSTVGEIIEVNEAICEARPAGSAAGEDSLRGGRGKRGLWEALAAEKAAEVGRLAGEAARALGCEAGLEMAEAVLRAGLLKLGGGMLGEALSADPGYRGPRVGCGRGHEAVFTGYREKVIDTVLGPVTLRRAWYHCARCGHGLAPRDTELGVAGASMSPGLAAMSDKAAAAVPFAQATGLLEDLAGVRLEVKRVERAAEASGSALAAASRSAAGLIARRKIIPLPPDPLPDKLYIVIDGTGVPVTAKETAGREGKGEDGRARTREVKMAVFFTQDRLDDEGYPVRDKASSSYIATFEPAAAFQHLVRAEGIRRGADHVRQLTVIGDGAAWIWNLAAATFPEATHIVDLYHAREHLHSLTRSLEFMLLDHKDEWLAARLEDLDYGYTDGIAAAARAYPLEGVKKDEVEKELGYFLNNAPRMRYHWFRSRGLFTGSGVVEAGCKSVIGQRVKLAGMHWTVNGADSIVTLRCAQASSQWEAICRNRHNQTGAA